MAERFLPFQASVINYEPGPEVLDEREILARGLELAESGVKIQSSLWTKDAGRRKPQPERKLQSGERVAFVGSGDSLRLPLSDGEEGVVGTYQINGCTGVAGVARYIDGSSLQYVSHRGPFRDMATSSRPYEIMRKQARSALDIDRFAKAARTSGELAGLDLFVAYHHSLHTDHGYLDREGRPNSWHLMDQVQLSAENLPEGSRVLYLPYTDDREYGHSLAAGRIDGETGIFWDGHEINFDLYLGGGQNTTGQHLAEPQMI